MREDVQPPAVRHAEHRLGRPDGGRELERLVEHRDQDVEPFQRELLLAEERAPQVALHRLDLAEARVEAALLVGGQRLPVAPRLDRLAQPHALLVRRDVLDLVGDRPAVGLLQPRQRLGEILAGHVDAEHRGRDPRLQLGRELRHEPHRVEGGVADRLRAERVEPRREMAVHAERLDERHRGRHTAEQLGVRRRSDRRRRIPGSRSILDGRVAVRGAAVPRQLLQQSREARKGRDDLGVAALEQGAPLRRDGLGILEVLVEQDARVTGIHAVDIVHLSRLCCTTLTVRHLPGRRLPSSACARRQ